MSESDLLFFVLDDTFFFVDIFHGVTTATWYVTNQPQPLNRKGAAGQPQASQAASKQDNETTYVSAHS